MKENCSQLPFIQIAAKVLFKPAAALSNSSIMRSRFRFTAFMSFAGSPTAARLKSSSTATLDKLASHIRLPALKIMGR